MIDALTFVSTILCITAAVSLVKGRQSTACALAFAAGITIGILSHMLGSAP